MTSDTRSLICGHVLLPNRACRPSAIVFGFANATILPLALANAQSAASFVPEQNKEILCLWSWILKYILTYLAVIKWPEVLFITTAAESGAMSKHELKFWVQSCWSKQVFGTLKGVQQVLGSPENLTSCTEIKHLHALQTSVMWQACLLSWQCLAWSLQSLLPLFDSKLHSFQRCYLKHVKCEMQSGQCRIKSVNPVKQAILPSVRFSSEAQFSTAYRAYRYNHSNRAIWSRKIAYLWVQLQG